MKKTAVLMIVLMLTVLASVAVGGQKSSSGDKGAGMVGRLFLFQKCDARLAPAVTEEATEEDAVAEYDANGCPVVEGPWPILPDNRRWGQMKYNLLGPDFRFSFEGKNLDPSAGYTLIYYPDPWPGEGLICLGDGTTTKSGNIQIHGGMEIPEGLPLPTDANYKPAAPSGAVGAKIWLVLSEDVECGSSMIGWRPASYLFEGNPIIYQPTESLDGDDSEEDGDVDNGDNNGEQPKPEAATAVNNSISHGKAYGKDKQK